MPELKVFASHPVQYHAPILRLLAARGIRLDVGYGHPGAAGHVVRDAEFGTEFQWDMDLLEGYPHRFFSDGDCRFGVGAAFRTFRWALKARRVPLLMMGWFSWLAWLIWLARVLLGGPTLLLSETTVGSFGMSSRPAWRRALLGWLLRHSSGHLCIGSGNRAFLGGMGVPEERLFPAPYSVDNARFAASAAELMPRRPELCRRHGLDPDLPVFLFCGKLIPKKRPLQLLDAYLAAGLSGRAQLLYVGDGMLRPEIERRAGEAGTHHVRILGFLNQTEMPLAYVLGELLCLISDPTETWGLVVNEALACGRPVIVSETCGCASDLVGSENGWIVPLDDHARLTAALQESFAQRSRWPDMGRAGALRVAPHSFERMADGVEAAVLARTG